MQRTLLVLASAALALAVARAHGASPTGDCSDPRAADGTYTALEITGQSVAIPTAINNRGDIVGYGLAYDPEAANGFLLRRGELTPIMVPGSFNTTPQDINDSGVIVGFYCVYLPEFGCGAFTWYQESFTTWPTSIDYWMTGYHLRAVNNGGTIAGRAADRGLVLRHGTPALVDVPGARSTWVEDINDRGDLLLHADFDEAPPSRYYVLSRDRLVQVSACAPGNETLARLTNQRALVGRARLGGTDPATPIVGIVASKRGVLAYQYPGTGKPYGWTALFDVNSAGYAVGAASSPSSDAEYPSHGFVFVPRNR